MKVPTAHKLKSGNWHIQLRLNKKSYSITAPTKKECTDKAMLLKAHYAIGILINADKAIPTLHEVMMLYIEDRKNVLSPSTIRGYTTIMNTRFIKYHDMRIDDTKFIQKMINDESLLCSPKTLKNAWGLVNASLKYWGIQSPEVCLPQIVPNEHEFFSADEIKSFIEIIRDDKYEMLYLFCLHGLRRSEAIALSLKSIDDGVIKIRGSRVRDKNGKLIYKETNKNSTSRRDVPIMIPRLSELLDRCDEDGLLFKFEPEQARKHMDTICKRNGLPKIGFHGLRHSFASLCAITLQLPEKEILKLGGWSNDQVLKKIYTHVADQEQTSATNKIKAFFA